MVTYPLRAGPSPPGSHRPVLGLSSPHRLSSVRRLHGPEHPDSGFRDQYRQHDRAPCNRSTSLRNTPCHGFHDSNRYTIRPAVLTTWHGTWISATQNVLNSMGVTTAVQRSLDGAGGEISVEEALFRNLLVI